jgi:hypothetical protein
MMRPVEAVAWADAFDVDVRDLPSVLTHEAARVDGVRTELAKLVREFSGAPDEEVRRGMYRAYSTLGAAESRVMAAAADARRSA